MEKKKIAAIIATYNRKELLKRCLKAISIQTFKPVSVYIVDNASTDGTIEFVKEWGYFNCERESIRYIYVQNSKNEGGAGAFYLGLKIAYGADEYDGFWVMDDDGIPDCRCLENLAGYLGKYDYIAPIVLSDEDKHSCSFALHHESIEEFCRQKNARDGIIENWASPFNGILYSKKLVEEVGYPKKEMFIWGDENNYQRRCQKAGFFPYTILSAIHYHPLNKVEYKKSLRRLISISDVKWKLYCCTRNLFYNTLRFPSLSIERIYNCMRLYASYIWYFRTSGGGLYAAYRCADMWDYRKFQTFK